MIRLCAFLGNQGQEYRYHRHNVAWLFLDSMRIASELRWSSKFKGAFTQIELGSTIIIF